MSRLAAKDRKLVERISGRKLTHLARPKLVTVMEACRALEDDDVPGAFLEVGCGLGGSSILIATAKHPKRRFRIYDDFEAARPSSPGDAPDVHDRHGAIAEGRGGPKADLYEVVLENLREFGIDPEAKSVSLIKGPLRDTLTIRGPVAFAHVDVDGYDPAMTSLTRIVPKLSPGGCIILDTYDDWGGCRKAADECRKGMDARFAFEDSDGSLKITRLAR